ncbi:glycosyltransferase family 2 protein [Salinisphaera sp.]|uniref:glycosyltransferase family 2 protein n=1 Tax=Salinisphaera sp. TaxID=1914330 RepID=UPI002D79CC14|nr:glycosyltransferase [Salinisphaera sp.]HET7314559.1 glycosyltransferase [Salinisphaera sp.]
MNPSSRITVSVIIPAFEAEGFLSRAVLSVVNQTEPVHEIIIVDDGSKDKTFDVAQMLAERYSSVRPLRLPKNSGPSASRNRGFEASTGNWLAILDADDTYEPDRIEVLSNAIRSIGEVDLLSDLLCMVDQDVEHQPDFALPESPMLVSVVEFLERARPNLNTPDLGLLKPVIRREFLSRTGVKYPERCRHGEDTLLMVQLLINSARYYVVSNYGYRYTTRHSGTSRTKVDYSGMKEANASFRNHAYFQNDERARAALDARTETLEKLDRDYRYQLSFREKLKRREYRLVSWELQKRAKKLFPLFNKMIR